MREIKFRGKRIDNDKWVYGFLVENLVNKICIQETFSAYEFKALRMVDPKTVGQYTGFDDENGNKIFEGDVVTYNETKYEVSEVFGSYVLQRADDEVIDYTDFPLSIFPYGSNEMEFIGSKNDHCVSFYELADNQQDIEGRFSCKVIGNIY